MPFGSNSAFNLAMMSLESSSEKQALILILGVLLYIPFVKINDVVMAKTMGEE